MKLIDDEETPIAYIENLEREVAELKERLHKLAADWQVKHYEIEELKVNNKLIAELESDYNRILSDFLELQAHINTLREALEEISSYQVDEVVDAVCNEALASTPAQSLIEHDNEVIERCAKVCESLKEQDYCVDVRAGAKSIRALKGDL